LETEYDRKNCVKYKNKEPRMRSEDRMKRINNHIFMGGLKNVITTMPLSFRMVFSNHHIYIVISACIFTTFWIIFNVFDQLLFFSPIITFYLPDDAVNGFVLTNIISVLMGVLVAMNVYIFRNSKLRLDKSIFSGAILGIFSSACASCSSIGFLIISTFGGIGILATDFLTNYQTPLRVVSIALLLWALYSVHNRITISSCVNTFSNIRKQQ
jgi:hypothetical protein